jgi:serine/threonine protein kinase
MTLVSNLALLDVLRQSGLLSREQLAALPQAAQGRLTDARAAARLLLQRGWLTVYQINQLLAGRGRELVLGPYHILDRLGQGGQSTVYKARHAQGGHVVALKVVRPDLVGNPEASRQFLLEMEALAQLDHPNIVQFLDADQVGEVYYCAMEYVEGTDLGKYVRLVGPLRSAEACTYVRQAALGLQHAHERNLIHRDIKPANLFLVNGGDQAHGLPAAGSASSAVIKILDWGLAGLRPPGVDRSGEAGGEEKGMVGTADYLSPEQALSPATVDIRGDLYSLGCTFYYLLTGRPPFPGGTLMQKILRHQQEEPTPLAELRPDLPAGLPAIIRRLMAKRPEDRFQTPAALALALAPYCRGGATPFPPRPRPVFPAGRPHEDTPLHGALDGEQSTSRATMIGDDLSFRTDGKR